MRLVQDKLCTICAHKFSTATNRQTRCTSCRDLCKHLHSAFSSSRGNKISPKVTAQTVINIAQKYVLVTHCVYCTRKFSAKITKSVDHIIPVCLGGSGDASNLEICCLDCNRCKSWLSLPDWVMLCQRVISTADSKQ